MEYLLLTVYLIAFVAIVYRCRFFTLNFLPKKWLLLLLTLKLLFGLCFFYIYCYHFEQGLDSPTTHASSVRLSKMLFEDPKTFSRLLLGVDGNNPEILDKGYAISNTWIKKYEQNFINENRTVIRIHAVLNFFSFYSYKINLLFMCFLSFVGSCFLYRFFAPKTKKNALFATLACFAIPSTLFWTCGVLKEPLFFFFCTSFLWLLKKNIQQIHWLSAFFCLICALFCLWTKLHLAIILLPLSFVYAINCFRKKHFFLSYLLFSLVVGTLLWSIALFCSNRAINMVQYISGKNNNFIAMEKYLHHDINDAIPVLDGTLPNLIKNCPKAIYNVLTQPHLDIKGFNLSNVAAVETIVFFLIILFSLLLGNYKTMLGSNQWLFGILFAIASFILIGLTCANIGAMVRYKAVILPFIAYYCLSTIRWELFKRRSVQ